MFSFTSLHEISGVSHAIDAINPGLVRRIRRAADTLNRHEIAARLADAITEAADAAHIRAWQKAEFGEASAEAIVDDEYQAELAAAWSLVASEQGLFSPELLIAADRPLH
jgi:hypothetical protein